MWFRGFFDIFFDFAVSNAVKLFKHTGTKLISSKSSNSAIQIAACILHNRPNAIGPVYCLQLTVTPASSGLTFLAALRCPLTQTQFARYQRVCVRRATRHTYIRLPLRPFQYWNGSFGAARIRLHPQRNGQKRHCLVATTQLCANRQLMCK